MFNIIVSAFLSLLEKLGINWWKQHEEVKREEAAPLTNAEEISDIDNLPSR